jgi:hypothetical protein
MSNVTEVASALDVALRVAVRAGGVELYVKAPKDTAHGLHSARMTRTRTVRRFAGES